MLHLVYQNRADQYRVFRSACSSRGAITGLADMTEQETKRREVGHARHPEVIASRSELLSLHCPRQPLLLALLPACAGSQFIMRQDCSAYAAEPLRTAGLLEAAHQYSLQDMCGSACSPSPLYSLLRRDSLRTYKEWHTTGLPSSTQHYIR